MDASAENIALLREKTGESIPEGGADTDTMFTDAQATTWLEAASNINYAVVNGWEFKLAQWAGLVNVVDGASSRSFSDLMDHAQQMLAYYRGQIAAGPGDGRIGRTRIGKIVRPYESY